MPTCPGRYKSIFSLHFTDQRSFLIRSGALRLECDVNVGLVLGSSDGHHLVHWPSDSCHAVSV